MGNHAGVSGPAPACGLTAGAEGVVARTLSRNREFMLLWSGQALSGLGSQISLVAYPLLVLAVTGSPAKAGLVGFIRNLPIALLAIPAGALADRANRKRLMVGCDVVRALAMTTIPIGLLTGDLPYAVIVAVAAIDGAGFVLTYVTERGALRQVVPAEQLGEAVARNESRTFGAMVAGPPLGGLLFGLARAVPFLADAASYAIAAVAKLLIRREFQEPDVGLEPGDYREGLRWLWRRPFFRACSLLFAASNPVFSGLLLLVVLLARHHRASAALIGVMLGIVSAGGLLGALLAPRLQRRLSARFVLIGENVMLVVSIPLLLVTGNALLIGLIVATAELITPVTNSIVVGYRVALAPDRLQGRVQAASTLISFSAGWLGPLMVGLLVQDVGLKATILALTGWSVLLAAGAVGSRAFRQPPVIADDRPTVAA